MKCPCENCIVLPMCKHKNYHSINHECKDVKRFLYLGSTYNISIHKINVKIFEKTLKPTAWRLGKETQLGFDLLEKR